MSLHIKLTHITFNYLNKIDDHNLTPFLTKWPTPPFKTRPTQPNQLPVLAHLPQIKVQENDKAATLIQTLQTHTTQLQWGQTYTTADFSPTFLANYGWTELIGLRGPIASQEIACGFLLLGPHTTYPKHSHQAQEVYLPLTFPTQWIQDTEAWVTKPKHIPIHHPSWLPHGMKTTDTPLLALYIWQGGNLTQKSHIEPS